MYVLEGGGEGGGGNAVVIVVVVVIVLNTVQRNFNTISSIPHN